MSDKHKVRSSETAWIKDFSALLLSLVGAGIVSYFVLEGIYTGEFTYRGAAAVDQDPFGFWSKNGIFVLMVLILIGFFIHTVIVMLRKLTAGK